MGRKRVLKPLHWSSCFVSILHLLQILSAQTPFLYRIGPMVPGQWEFVFLPLLCSCIVLTVNWCHTCIVIHFFSPLFGIACHPWLDKWFSNFSHQVNTSFGFPAYWGAFSLRAVSSLPSFSKVSSFASPLITFELLLCTAPSFCSKACLSYSICSNLCNINCNSGLGDLPLPRLL